MSDSSVAQRLAVLEEQVRQANEHINFLLSHTSPDNSPDLRISHIEDETKMLEMFIIRLVDRLVIRNIITKAELMSVLTSLEEDYPLPSKTTATSEGIAILWMFKTFFSEMPQYQTKDYKQFRKETDQLRKP